MDHMVLLVVVGLVCFVLAALCVYAYLTHVGTSKLEQVKRDISAAEQNANRIIRDAEREAKTTKKTALVEAKEEIYQLKQKAESEEKQRKRDLQSMENRIMQREETLDRRSETLDKKEHQLSSLQGQLDRKKHDVDELFVKQTTELERISTLTRDEAHNELLQKVRESTLKEEAQIIRDSEARIKFQTDKMAREIISVAIQRCAADQAGEITVTTVHIPSDDLKGRIIGREGRNIRTFEQISGVSLVIDDTPETVVLSSFSPVRREIARVTLENLIADGRIHPARIEEMFKKAQSQVREQVQEAGEQAAFDVGIHDMHPELMRVLGALKYRTSFGQNVLQHCVQVGILCGIMASELGFETGPAKRAGLLHDIGKAIDHEVEGPHAVIGAELCRRYGEKPEVVHAVEAHHADIEPKTVLDVLVQAADAISAARPGARRESAENYIKRLEKLEEISNAHEGVARTYAMQAGRELHVMVEPEKISDAAATVLAHDIAKQIEEEMEYPGQVRVVVIRESRAYDIAKFLSLFLYLYLLIRQNTLWKLSVIMSEPHKDMKDFLDSVAPQSNLRVEEKLGCGFVRLRIREAERRQAQQDIRCVEDIVIELLRNSRDAGAHHIFVATTKQDTIRTITVLDDGVGIPQSMHDKIFEARVTSKLDSVHSDHWGIHGRGMALYAIKEQAQQAYVASSLPGLGTALVVRVNTDKVTEKRDQSSRPLYHALKQDSGDTQSRTQIKQAPTSDFELVGPHNIIRTCCDFALRESKNCEVYLGTPTEIIATLYTLVSKRTDVQDFLFADSLDSLPIIDRFFAASDSHELMDVAHHCALEVSERNIHRILSGHIKPVKSLSSYFRKTHQSTPAPINIYDTKRAVHLTPEDKALFARNLSSTFDKLAQKYYIGLVREPSIVMRNNKIIVTFDYDESDFV